MILLLVSAAHLGLWLAWREMKRLEPARVPQQAIEVSLQMLAPAPKAQEPAASPAPAPTAPPKPVTPPKPKPVAKPKPVTKTLPKPLPVKPAEEASTKSEVSSAPPPESASAARSEGGAASAQAVPPSTPANFSANYLHNPVPEYPAFAKKQRWQGKVMLKVHVLPTGLPAEVELQGSSGHDILDESAVETVRRWRFVPATKGGKAVASWVVVPLEFSLSH